MTFTITVLNKGKRAKDSEVSEITVDLASLANGEEVGTDIMCVDVLVYLNMILHYLKLLVWYLVHSRKKSGTP